MKKCKTDQTGFVEALRSIGHTIMSVSRLNSLAVSANQLLGAYFYLLTTRERLANQGCHGVDDLIDQLRKTLKQLIDRMDQISQDISK